MAKEVICLRIDPHHIDLLKQMARKRSVKQNKDTRYTDLLREAIVSYLRALTGKNDLE